MPSNAEPQSVAKPESLAAQFAELRWVGENNAYFEEMRKRSLAMGSNAIPFLLAKLEIRPGQPDTGKIVNERRKAAMALGWVGAAATEKVVPRLIEALEDEADWDYSPELKGDVRTIRVSAVAADALGHLGPKAASAVPALNEALKFGNPRGLIALARIAPESGEVITTLAAALNNTRRIQLPLEGDFPSAALDALGIAAKRNAAVLPILAGCLQHGEPSVREKAAQILARLGRELHAADTLLAEKLKTGTLREKTQLAAALAGEGKKGKEVFDVLLAALRSDDDDLKLASLKVIGTFRSQAEEVAPVLAGILKGKNERLRAKALLAYAQTGRRDPEIVPVVIESLGSSDFELRQWALGSLNVFGESARAAEPVLLNLLRDPDFTTRSLAAGGLGAIKAAPERALPALREALNDPETQVRNSAMRSLAKFGEVAKELIPAIVEKLEGTNSWAAASALGDFGPLAGPAVPALAKALQSKDWGLRSNAANALGRIGPVAKAAVPALMTATQDSEGNVRVNAAFALWKIDRRTDALDVLIKRLQSDDEFGPMERFNIKPARITSIRWLGEIGPAAKAAVPALEELRKGPDDDLRAAAEEALKLIRGNASEEGKRVPEAKPRSAAELFKQLDLLQSRQKRSQAKLLHEFTHLQPSVVPFLIQQLENQNQPTKGEAVEARRKAAWLLSEMGATAKPALAALVRALEDSDDRVAQAAADALGAIGPDAHEALPALIEALKFRNYGAARALVKIASEAPQVATALLEAFEDKAYPLRDQLVYAMADLKSDRKRLEASLVAAYREGDAYLLAPLAFALNKIEAKSPEAMKAIRAWQRGQRENTDLTDTGDATVSELIEQLRTRQSSMNEVRTLQRLRRLGPKAEQAVPALIEYLNDRAAQYRYEAAGALAEIGPAAKEAVPALLAYIKGSSEPGRGNAATALGAIGPAAKEAVPTLIDAVMSDEYGLSINAARSLGLIGPAATAAIPALKQALTDAMPMLRLQAAASLWRIDSSFTPMCVPILIELIEHPPKENRDLSWYISMVFGEIGSGARDALPSLERVLARPEDSGRWNAASAICRIDPSRANEIIPKLIKALEDKDDLYRGRVAFALGELGAAGKTAVPALTAAKKDDDDANLREQAARALEKIAASKP